MIYNYDMHDLKRFVCFIQHDGFDVWSRKSLSPCSHNISHCLYGMCVTLLFNLIFKSYIYTHKKTTCSFFEFLASIIKSSIRISAE